MADANPLRTRAIDASRRALMDVYGRPKAMEAAVAVDALLAAGLLHDPHDSTGGWPRFPRVQGACPACGAHALFLGDGGYVTCAVLTCSDPCRASRLLGEPRDDEARIERAARDDEAVDVVTRVCREVDPQFMAEGGSTRHWTRDHFLPALRAEGYVIALAAADQEDATVA